MSQPTQSQSLIFSLTGLAIAIVVISVLFYDQSKMTQTIDEQLAQLEQLQEQVEQSKEFNQTQLSRLDQMTGNQKELGVVIGELQGEISNLNNKYLQTKETARLSVQNLEQAQQTIGVLKADLYEQEQQLARAQQTILSQQRALQAQTNPELRNEQLSAAVSEFSKSLTQLASDISIVQTSHGQAIINIPLTRLFDPGTLELSAESRPVLTSIAEQLSRFTSLDIQVIGHSDARPIVSILSEKYPTNWELSSVRASKVVNYLVDNGISEARLTAAGKAANEPVRISDSVEDLAVNRRIEILLN